jgi:hypothetical protein
MKVTNWSAAVLVGFAGLSATHCNIAHALTYEETACVSQMYMEGQDPTKCFNTGGDGGSAGSGGSGSASGEDGDTRGGLSPEPNTCEAPAFWFFTGPPDPESVWLDTISNDSGQIVFVSVNFAAFMGGQSFIFQRKSRVTGGTTIWNWGAHNLTTYEPDHLYVCVE